MRADFSLHFAAGTTTAIRDVSNSLHPRVRTEAVDRQGIPRSAGTVADAAEPSVVSRSQGSARNSAADGRDVRSRARSVSSDRSGVRGRIRN
jgi:hypothetical protein